MAVALGATAPAVFLDKDGTLIDDVPYSAEPAHMKLTPNAALGLRLLHRAGFRMIVVSNQSGVARGMFPEEALGPVEETLRSLFAGIGVPLDGFHYCPHHPEGVIVGYSVACTCRKPSPGLVLQAARQHRIDLSASWLIGDILDDVEAGNRAGCRTILLDVGGETEWRLGPHRIPDAVAKDLTRAARLILQAEPRRPWPASASAAIEEA